MIQYFGTTTTILIWCFLLSIFWAVGVYTVVSRLPKAIAFSDDMIFLPSLVLGPVVLVIFFHWFGINLIFPPDLLSEFKDTLLAAVIPSVILLIASGLLPYLTRSIIREYFSWRTRTFSVVAQAVGKDVGATLRRLVLMRALVGAWSQCLPWLFGELIIVECVFNAPGVALDAWHLARQQDLFGFSMAILVLVVLYAACVMLTFLTNRWLGKRLESYV